MRAPIVCATEAAFRASPYIEILQTYLCTRVAPATLRSVQYQEKNKQKYLTTSRAVIAMAARARQRSTCEGADGAEEAEIICGNVRTVSEFVKLTLCLMHLLPHHRRFILVLFFVIALFIGYLVEVTHRRPLKKHKPHRLCSFLFGPWDL